MMSLASISRGVVEAGLIALLVFTPFALSCARALSCSLMELILFLLFGFWALCRARVRLAEGKEAASGKGAGSQSFVRWHFTIPFLLLVGLGAVQLICAPGAAQVDELLAGILAGERHCLRPLTLNAFNTELELLKIAACGAALILVLSVIKTRSQVNRLVGTVILMGTCVAALGIAQFFTPGGKLCWVWGRGRSGWAFGPCVNHDDFAGYLLMVIPFCVGLVIYSGLRRQKPHESGDVVVGALRLVAGSPLQLLLFAGAVLMVCALFLSSSKSAIAGFAVSSVVFVLMVLREEGMSRKAGGLLVVLVLVTACSLLLAGDSGARRLASLLETKAHGAGVLDTSIRIWQGFPLFGTGLGTFQDVFPVFTAGHDGAGLDAAERANGMRVLCEAGVVGALLAGSFLLLWFSYCMRASRRSESRWAGWVVLSGIASAAGVLAQGVGDMSLYAPANALLFVVLLALTSRAARIEKVQRPAPKGRDG